jgi:transcriptional regulator with XRE-family HTH domain
MLPMTLKQYMDEHKISLGDMASKLGVSVGGLRKNLSGERFPRRALLKTIEEVTGGAVTAKDFVGQVAA